MAKAKAPNQRAYGDLAHHLKAAAQPGEWAVVVTKSMRGRDGDIYQATIFRNGMVVGDAFNDGHGGETTVRLNDDDPSLLNGPTRVALRAYAETQGFDLGRETVPHTVDSFVSVLAEFSLDLKRYKRAAKKGAFMVRDGRMFATTLTPSDTAKAYPDAVVLNDALSEV